MYRGYVKVWRKIYDNPLSKKPEYLSVWLYLFTHANHEDKEFIFNNKKQTVKRGQLLTGRKKISIETGINESNVQRILKYLENEQQIEQQTFNVNRIITVTNYDYYQKYEQQIEQPENNQRTTREQPMNTNNTLKELESIKKNVEEEKILPVSSQSGKKEKEGNRKQVKPTNPNIKVAIDYFYNKFLQKTGARYHVQGGKDSGLIKKLLGTYTIDEVQILIDKFFESEDEFILKAGYSIGVFHSQIPKLLTPQKHSLSSIGGMDELKKWVVRHDVEIGGKNE